jgi:hypothetical protein
MPMDSDFDSLLVHDNLFIPSIHKTIIHLLGKYLDKYWPTVKYSAIPARFSEQNSFINYVQKIHGYSL